MIIEVSNLVKKYKDFVAVNGIGLSIKEGEIFGLLGPNGAGKSTTLNTLLGLLKISRNNVYSRMVYVNLIDNSKRIYVQV